MAATGPRDNLTVGTEFRRGLIHLSRDRLHDTQGQLTQHQTPGSLGLQWKFWARNLTPDTCLIRIEVGGRRYSARPVGSKMDRHPLADHHEPDPSCLSTGPRFLPVTFA